MQFYIINYIKPTVGVDFLAKTIHIDDKNIRL